MSKKYLGRLATGERFVFTKFSNRLRIQKAHQLVLLENFILDPENDTVYPWQNSFPLPLYGCLYLASTKVAGSLPCRDAIHNMQSGESSSRSNIYA